MAEFNRTIVGIFVALLVIVFGAFAWWWFGREPEMEPTDIVAEATPVPEPTPTPSLEERLSASLAGTTLSTSDTVVRELVGKLSANPKLAAWLVNEDLIRLYVASVDNIAAGISPSSQLEFLRPKKGFEVEKKADGTFVIAPASYERYDVVAEVVASLDTQGTAALYRELEPLVDDAYAEISPAGKKFDDRLARAFDQLLAVPVLDSPQRVDQLVVTYAWSNEELENLTSAQRHLLRMGPENVSRIQAKLGEIRAALAAPTEQ